MMKGVEVKKALLESNLQVQEVAKQLGYTRGHISGVINGRLDSFKVKKSIALLLGKDFDLLWTRDSDHKAGKPATV